jgi:hypothetical protein
MTKRSSFFVCAGSVCLALGLIPGCNAALGIDEAQLRPGDSSGGTSSGPVNVSGPRPFYTIPATCISEVSTDCSNCIANAKPDSDQCLGDSLCRNWMLGYATCLGENCTPNAAKCFEPLVSTVGTPVGSKFSACESACDHTPIFSTCELYCGCMLENCSAKFATFGACMTACGALDPEAVNCRWTHCEAVKNDKLMPPLPHCEHAVGNLGICPPNGSMRPETCTDSSPKSFFCATDADCCSGNCDLGNRTCN